MEEISNQRLQDRLCRYFSLSYFCWSDRFGGHPSDIQRGQVHHPHHIVRDRTVVILLPKTGRGGPDVLHLTSPAMVLQSLSVLLSPQTLYHFERHTVRQTVDTVLLFIGNSHDWALYLLDLPLNEWSWRVTWGPAVWRPWTHCSLFDGVPLPRVWGCIGYYPSLALRQFGGIQYLPRLGDLSSVTFDYVPGDDMWRFLTRVEDIWRGRCSEMVLVEDGLLADSSVSADFVEWREGWSPSFTLRPTVRPGLSHLSDNQCKYL